MQSGCRPLDDSEIDGICAKLSCIRDKTLLILGVKTGFRISELLSLKVSDVFQFGRVVDHVTVSRRFMKKRVRSRTVPMHAEAKVAILELITNERLQPTHFLFQSRVGRNKAICRRQAWHVLKEAMSAAQVGGRTGTHCMRKTFAQKVYDKLDHDLLRTSRALGHKSINSTVSYLSFAEEEIETAILEI